MNFGVTADDGAEFADIKEVPNIGESRACQYVIQMKNLSKKQTIGVKVLREEVPMIHKVARRLGYKNLHQWLETIFRREYTKALSEIVGADNGASNATQQTVNRA